MNEWISERVSEREEANKKKNKSAAHTTPTE